MHDLPLQKQFRSPSLCSLSLSLSLSLGLSLSRPFARAVFAKAIPPRNKRLVRLTGIEPGFRLRELLEIFVRAPVLMLGKHHNATSGTVSGFKKRSIVLPSAE